MTQPKRHDHLVNSNKMLRMGGKLLSKQHGIKMARTAWLSDWSMISAMNAKLKNICDSDPIHCETNTGN